MFAHFMYNCSYPFFCTFQPYLQFNKDKHVFHSFKMFMSKILLFFLQYSCTLSNNDNNDIRSLESRIAQMEEDMEDRVAKLEQLARIGTLRSCAEYSRYGLKSSGMYNIDPDGPLLGSEPFQVYCNFDTGATEVLHDSENLTVIDHCHDPGNKLEV